MAVAHGPEYTALGWLLHLSDSGGIMRPMPTDADFAVYHERLQALLDEGVPLLGASALTGMIVTMLLRLPERHSETTVNKVLGAFFGGLSHNMTAGRVDLQAVFDAVERAEVDPQQVTKMLSMFTKLISLLAGKRNG